MKAGYAFLAALLLALPIAVSGQGRGAPPAQTPKAAAPIDLTGYWVSVVTQDWRFRMAVPGKGEYGGIPINERSKAAADAFDRDRAEKEGAACDAYGAGMVMRNPERIHLTWADENTLKVETDAGQQVRLLHFDQTRQVAAEPSRQGNSRAAWRIHQQAVFFGPPIVDPSGKRYGFMQVKTDNLLPGLLRKNGVPYGSQASMNDYWEVQTMPNGTQLLLISTQFEDPENLTGPYLFNPIFMKEPDGSKWSPSSCSLRW
jgi:hypothetical protein